MNNSERKTVIGVIGASDPKPEDYRNALEAGRLIARSGSVLICGGLGGVMEGAARGAVEEGGLTIGILPGNARNDANDFIKVPVATGMGEARNVVIVKSSDCLIAIGGGYGTLSEIALAMRYGVRVIGLETWHVRGNEPDRVVRAESAEEAVRIALETVREKNHR